MAVTISGGEIVRAGVFQSVEALSNSTATTLRTVSAGAPITTIAGGTATGFAINRYLVSTASAAEGQTKMVVMLATGEAYVIYAGTATGAAVLTDANDRVALRFVNALWVETDAGSATRATATGTA
jgi:F0F1-type ATP synthase membrane subunit c/vacuolar-type H+-ATPase subunit K